MRLLSCPATLTFAELHRALQIAFGWASTHAYDFAVQDPDYEEEEDADIRKMIQEIQFGKSALEPTEFLCRISEKEQGGGGFGHIDKMHEGKRKHPRTPEKNSWKTKLFQILDDPKYGGVYIYLSGMLLDVFVTRLIKTIGNDIEYMYDFGDNWSHIITLEGRQAPTLNLTCTDGTGHGVAEDVKQSGWAELKEAYRTSSPTQEQRELRNWFENEASNCDPDGLGGGREFRWAEGEVNRRFAEAGL